MRNLPYKPPKSEYDFTKMSDAQIEAELATVRFEREQLERRLRNNVIIFDEHRSVQ